MKINKLLISVISILIIGSAFFILKGRQKTSTNITYEQEILQPKTDFQSKIDEFINEGPAFLEKSTYKTIGEIINKLGRPINIKETKAKNIHNPEVTDTVYTLFYDGLHIINYTAKANDKGWIQHISITKNSYNLKYGISIGSSRKFIASTLGKPQETKDDRWIYIDSDGYEDTATFYFRNDIVTKIEWDFWID